MWRAALNSGRVVIMVVWCSVLGEYVTIAVNRKMVFVPTAAETEAMLAAVRDMASAGDAERSQWRRRGRAASDCV